MIAWKVHRTSIAILFALTVPNLDERLIDFMARTGRRKKGTNDD